MGGGLLQLIASNIQDKHLTSNPEFTYFKKAYFKYTNFSFETFQYHFEGKLNFGLFFDVCSLIFFISELSFILKDIDSSRK